MATNIVPNKNFNFVSDKTRSWSYPTSAQLNFGTDFAGSEYIIPVVRFQFYDSVGDDTSSASPIIYIKMGGTFQSGLSNSWNPATNIYGTPGGSVISDDSLEGIKRLGSSFYEALQKQLMNTVGGAAGAFASAGQSGKANFEFIQRQVFNNFQQLIYSGPVFRQFSLPFSMKPTSLTEAKAMRDIIQTFRIASSPRIGSLANSDATDDLDEDIGEDASDLDDLNSIGGGEGGITGTELDALIAGSGQSKLFGYPDMCKFQLLLYNRNVGDLSILFESNLCVIENVSTDYGSGNKMTFFDGDEYFPTDVLLSLSLRETKLLTTVDIAGAYNNRTMF
jgi:hypothetical protein